MLRRALIFLSLVLLTGAACAASDAPAAYQVPRSEVHEITSEALGRRYALYVKRPPGYDAPKNAERRYPVIYLNDATYTFQTAAGVAHMPMNFGGLEHAFLVGISYARGESGVKSRSRDYTPTPLGAGARFDHGGARDYLAFLRDEVIPFIENEYRADPEQRTLVGQSYGGLFGAYALLAAPGLFSGYILTSPSLWYDDKTIFAMEEDAAASNRALEGRVYFATGETEIPSIHGGRYDMTADQKRFADRLRSRGHKGLEVMDDIIPGATHQTTFPIGLTRGLMRLHPGPDPYNGAARWHGE